MAKTFLDKAYEASDPQATRALYDDWAASYEAEIIANGYATPARCAQALRQFVTDNDTAVLDFGCGTGLSGVALKAEGFATIDGLDLSSEMLGYARLKGVYNSLTQIEAGAALPFADGAYSAMTAIGVIGAGAAPVSVLHTLMRKLARGGKLAFSFNDHALALPEHEGAISEWTDCGAAHLLMREYGDHLPGIDIKANVYVLEKA